MDSLHHEEGTRDRASGWRLGRSPDGGMVRRRDVRTIDGDLLSLTAYVQPSPGREYQLHIFRVAMERERLAGPIVVATLASLEALAARISRGGRAAVAEIRRQGMQGVIS